MVNYERKVTSHEVESIGYDLAGLTLDEAIEFFQKKKIQYEDIDCKLDWDYDRPGYYDNDRDKRLAIMALVTETDSAYQTRISREEARERDIAKEKVDKEREEFERLKKKFGE